MEGDSAGGTAKQGRDRTRQAILPLRGKILNTEALAPSKVLQNKELSELTLALVALAGEASLLVARSGVVAVRSVRAIAASRSCSSRARPARRS